MIYFLMIAVLFFAVDAFAAGVDCLVKGRGMKGRERFIVTADTPVSAFDKIDKEIKSKGLMKARAACSSPEYRFEISVRKK